MFFNILGKFFFFYMIFGTVWTIYNKRMYGQSNVDEHSTNIGVVSALVLVIAIEVWGLINKAKKKEEK
jgi:uncharacterized membrane protein